MPLDRPSRDELLELDYLQLQRWVADIMAEMYEILEILPELVGQYKEYKARFEILKQLKSIGQSLLRAQRDAI